MFIGEGQEWADGEEHAWKLLKNSAPSEICRRTGAHFNQDSGAYVLKVFNTEIEIYPGSREIKGTGELGSLLLDELPHYSRLSTLHYLVQAQDIPLSGTLVNPRELSGGLIFAQGAHRLPLDMLAAKYDGDSEQFLKKGTGLGGEARDYGDASIMLYPFPKIPVLLVLWNGDEDFPAGTELLLDATCELHLPPDIIWATAMMSALVMV